MCVVAVISHSTRKCPTVECIRNSERNCSLGSRIFWVSFVGDARAQETSCRLACSTPVLSDHPKVASRCRECAQHFAEMWAKEVDDSLFAFVDIFTAAGRLRVSFGCFVVFVCRVLLLSAEISSRTASARFMQPCGFGRSHILQLRAPRHYQPEI